MQLSNQIPDKHAPEPGESAAGEIKHDEDVRFEVEKESTLVPLTESPDATVAAGPVGESTIPAKEETLGKSDFPPLTEAEKQPKIDEDLSPQPPTNTDD